MKKILLMAGLIVSLSFGNNGAVQGSEATPDEAFAFFDQKLEEVCSEESYENIRKAFSVLYSEEFNEVMAYPEMQELVLIILKECADLAVEDPALTAQILEKLGVDEQYTSLLENEELQKIIRELYEEAFPDKPSDDKDSGKGGE